MRLDRQKVLLARERLGYGIEKVAEEAGVSKNSVLRAEHEGAIRPVTARKIAAALGVRVEDLLPKAQSPLFPPPGQWGGGVRYEEPPPPEEGGPERGYLRPGERLRIHTAPGAEWLMPRLRQIERGEMSADDFMRELEEYVQTH